MAEHAPRPEAGHAGAAHGADPDPELRTRVVLQILLVLTVLTVVFAVLMWPLVQGFLRSDLRRETARPVEVDNSRPPGPLLQADPPEELRELRQEEDRVLQSYGWVDRESGVARVPVERAAELVLEQGVGPLAPASAGDENP